jgi:hypothetical protein
MKIVSLPVSYLRGLALSLILLLALGFGLTGVAPTTSHAKRTAMTAHTAPVVRVADSGVETHGKGGGKGRSVTFS